jgi:hypothetical protein
MIHLDALSPEVIYHFISTYSHLLRIPLRLSVKLADSFPLEGIAAVLNPFSSVNRLDIRRQGARGYGGQNANLFCRNFFFVFRNFFSRFLSLCRHFLGFLGDPKIVAAQVCRNFFLSAIAR